MNNSAFPYGAFLSHSLKEKAVVRLLAERLRKDGLRVWLDAWVPKPGAITRRFLDPRASWGSLSDFSCHK
jgi:hypothetical protein